MDPTKYFAKKLAETPVPAGKSRRTFYVAMVLDVDQAWIRDPDYLSYLADGVSGLLKTRDEDEDLDPWVLRDVTVYDSLDRFSADARKHELIERMRKIGEEARAAGLTERDLIAILSDGDQAPR